MISAVVTDVVLYDSYTWGAETRTFVRRDSAETKGC